MGLKIITPATLEPITLDQLKSQCRVDTSDEDALLTLAIAAARAKAEGYMGAAIMRRTVEQTLDDFPEAEIEVQLPPAWSTTSNAAVPLSLVSVEYLDESGVNQTISNTLYTLEDASWPFWVLPAVDVEWPSTLGSANCVRVRYQTGYADQASVPGDVRAWLLLTAAFIYAQREVMVLDGKVAEIPSRFVDSLLDPYRVFKV